MRIRLIYIGGSHRSGTTLIHRMLGQLPGVLSLGEVCYLWDAAIQGDLCTCGRSVVDCEFWSEVGRQAFAGWTRTEIDEVRRLAAAVDRARFVPFLMRGGGGRLCRLARSYATYYSRVYAAASEISGSRIIVDSSKRASLVLCLAKLGDIDLRVFHVVRDSRGVAYSCTKDLVRPDAVNGASLGKATPARTSIDWMIQNTAFEILKQDIPTEYVRYEKFVEDPGETMIRIAESVGVQAREAIAGFCFKEHVRLGTGHSIGGNPMRAQSGSIPLRLDDAWRTELRRTDRLLVSALTYPLRRRYARIERDG